MKSRQNDLDNEPKISTSRDDYVDAHPHTAEYKWFLRRNAQAWANPETDRVQLSNKRRPGAWGPLIALFVAFGGLYLAIAGVPDFVVEAIKVLGF